MHTPLCHFQLKSRRDYDYFWWIMRQTANAGFLRVVHPSRVVLERRIATSYMYRKWRRAPIACLLAVRYGTACTVSPLFEQLSQSRQKWDKFCGSIRVNLSLFFRLVDLESLGNRFLRRILFKRIKTRRCNLMPTGFSCQGARIILDWSRANNVDKS